MGYLQEVVADAFGGASDWGEPAAAPAPPDIVSSATPEVSARSGLPSAPEERGAVEERPRQTAGPGHARETALHGAELPGDALVARPRTGVTLGERADDDGEYYRAGVLRNLGSHSPGNASAPSTRTVLSTSSEAHQNATRVVVSPRAEVPRADGEGFVAGDRRAAAADREAEPGVSPDAGGQQAAPAVSAPALAPEPHPGRAPGAPLPPQARASLPVLALKTEQEPAVGEAPPANAAAGPAGGYPPVDRDFPAPPARQRPAPASQTPAPASQPPEPSAAPRVETAVTADAFLHVARTVCRLEPLLRHDTGRAPEAAAPPAPRVHIGTVEIVVAAPAPPAAAAPPPSDLASRRYLRRF